MNNNCLATNVFYEATKCDLPNYEEKKKERIFMNTTDVCSFYKHIWNETKFKLGLSIPGPPLYLTPSVDLEAQLIQFSHGDGVQNNYVHIVLGQKSPHHTTIFMARSALGHCY